MRNNILLSISLLIILLFSIFSCANQDKKRTIVFPKTDLAAEHFIPLPLNITSSHSVFALDEFTSISTPDNNVALQELGSFLSNKINKKTGLNLQINTDDISTSKTYIRINQTDNIPNESNEYYQLIIKPDSITLNSNTEEGAFRGIQTLLQIIPEQSNDTLAENKIWIVPTGEITDYPQFRYRGAMLDLARHFFSVQDVKKYIDLLAYYKFNALHLHLSDDQGWRIEIKSWPKLTEIGSSTEVGGESGGFYTQEDYKEIVKYAADHFMMIVPEIDMPGHTNAASVAYPFLNGNGEIPKLYTGIEVGFSTFDTRKDSVYKFIDDVIREISAISPGPYFHIGGDESHVTKKEDYIYFVNKVEKIVQKHGKIMIGWDEVATTDIDSTSISQFWASKENAKLAVTKNMNIILSPAKKAYLDMKYDENSKYGLSWAGYITTDTSYIWSPETYAEVPLENIIGIEAPLWSETISNIDELEYLAFPRVLSYAELGWTIKENRNWDNYKVRLANQASFFKRMNVKYYPSSLIDWKK